MVQKGLLNFFRGKLLLHYTPSHQSQLHRSEEGAQIKRLHFSISLEFSLVAKCNARFIKKISQFKRNIRSSRCKNFSLKQASGLIEGAGRGRGMIRHCIA